MKVGLGVSRDPTSFNSNKENIFSARVKKIILDDKNYSDLFKEFGEWNSIGLIFFEDVKNPNSVFEKQNFAFPLFPNYKNYPLENEIVFIIKLASTDIQNNPYNITYYYFTPINLWNSVHHNGLPDNIYSENFQSDYQQTEAGSVRRVKDQGTDIDLGFVFKEKSSIKSLQPFEGDVIQEGRFGNSIRFGSTSKGNIKNIWSDSGENGSPILILRNGQFEDNTDPWIPIVEDINKDLSNIYLTSTQKIPIKVSSDSYKSYKNQPISTKEYNKSQVIISSGRLLFNSKEDSILFSSKKTINLNAVESVNIDTKEFIIDSNKIYLGKNSATEPLILGNKMVKLLQKLFTGLTELCATLNTVGTPIPYAPNVAVIQSAAKMSSTLGQLIGELQQTTSKNNYTI